MSIKKFLTAAAAAVAVLIAAGCASNGYQNAFSAESSLKGNRHTYAAPEPQVFRTVKLALLRQGFNIDQADASSGLIKATRNLQDPSDKDTSYNINVSIDVSADDDNSIVTLAASQQTVLHRSTYDWWHLLWIIPIFPDGVEYQTVVTHEGNVTDLSFYNDFFASVERDLPKLAVVSPQQAVTPETAPAPAAAESSAPAASASPQAVGPGAADQVAPASAPGGTAGAAAPVTQSSTPASPTTGTEQTVTPAPTPSAAPTDVSARQTAPAAAAPAQPSPAVPAQQSPPNAAQSAPVVSPPSSSP